MFQYGVLTYIFARMLRKKAEFSGVPKQLDPIYRRFILSPLSGYGQGFRTSRLPTSTVRSSLITALSALYISVTPTLLES